MHLVMFDIDGTLIQSCELDAICFSDAVNSIVGIEIKNNLSDYTNITVSGILDEFIAQVGLINQRDEIHHRVKDEFVRRVNLELKVTPVREIEGAISFLNQLKSRQDVEVSIATGGWEDSAQLKLKSAGFDISGIAFASASDHVQRTKIMQVSESRCKCKSFISKTYFGDGVWDKKACIDLAYNFVLVGERLEHSKQIDNFLIHPQVMSHIGI
ncbi:HAD hydrolase-like protein [Pseudomonadota bacterium]